MAHIACLTHRVDHIYECVSVEVVAENNVTNVFQCSILQLELQHRVNHTHTHSVTKQLAACKVGTRVYISITETVTIGVKHIVQRRLLNRCFLLCSGPCSAVVPIGCASLCAADHHSAVVNHHFAIIGTDQVDHRFNKHSSTGACACVDHSNNISHSIGYSCGISHCIPVSVTQRRNLIANTKSQLISWCVRHAIRHNEVDHVDLVANIRIRIRGKNDSAAIDQSVTIHSVTG